MPSIVLLEPEQPGNVGTIGRTCVCAGASLHLIDPLGFHITDRHIKRAGLDYWPRLDVHRYVNYRDFLDQCFANGSGDSSSGPEPREGAVLPKLWFVTTKAPRTYCDVGFGPDDFLMFGKESAGIPEEILTEHPERCIRIPMSPEERSLNLSNSVSIVLYELLRQNGFPNLKRTGEFRTRHGK